MLFNSWVYAIFLVVVFALYHHMQHRGQNYLLLLGSYFFYGWWDWRFTGLLLVYTLVNYKAAHFLTDSRDGQKRKLLLVLVLIFNLGILGFFKYFNFFVDSFTTLLGAIGLTFHTSSLQIILPVGISFYTFQTLGYVLDVYHRKIPATRDPIAFGVYVSYFPQLVAGPIERAQNLLPQIQKKRAINADRLASGALLILIGLVRKIAIADVAGGYVDDVFQDTAGFGSAQLFVAILLFAVQIYCDFASYTDIARGSSRLLGIELMENFRHPYFATNLTEFWRRWHISLSTWLRDYVYIPLGGSRCRKLKKYRNIMITMLLGGLWHGAAWNFVAWGGLHGLGLVIHKFWVEHFRPLNSRSPRGIEKCAKIVFFWALTMFFTGFAWILFRSAGFGQARDIVCQLIAFQGGLDLRSLLLPVFLISLLLALDLPQYLSSDKVVLLRAHWAIRGLVYAALVMILLVLGKSENVPFIYFQF